ncbi:aldose 1-epimerase [Tuwongella immobilis]|uniref:Aldose 1-epimerase n=1 Tax=Tuwongella immobilis TaxID=692036 RepID=A0A6C2YTX7_9BACT|nr:aldose 1-epimerase [Tuwongella immobilis]VIP04342.1 aldose 1-epimerase : Aldose 1-epimerase OS=Planctomyces limnophilus (strain ATCC 43296 / DSM 3776 / IFAM 1008 / 290) GN=Plim_0702 PE=4 SV=1: Aldose_epim [Tuwongella immobilis]VTS06046.1 aldose 1-epimerase : Aldose 1-epimerase OS=Planctomyces limnophilus (strain ATCC 43296 / DSM 3776 / IFAM 1008 / 290) GN=Plim_0702 PE=4 SV=1: Aldose_epim [Tuwongella immobilis]
MRYTSEILDRTAGGKASPVVVLRDSRGPQRVEVWLGHGFNTLRWQVADPTRSGLVDLLYVDPAWEETAVPTRSGFPILFPFPNRIRDGHWVHDGTPQQLPLNDSTHKNAIHGFSPRLPWRLLSLDQDVDEISVTGELARADVPDGESLWPVDFRILVTVTLSANRLTIASEITNPDTQPLPWGLGYHPYFRHPAQADGDLSRVTLQTAARSRWELVDSLPTGVTEAVTGKHDFQSPRLLADHHLDDLYGDLPNGRRNPKSGLFWRATLGHADAPGRLEMNTSPIFRELVLFTPPHRKAVAIEPYTCTTDAANLAAAGKDVGWQLLPPGGSNLNVVELIWEPNAAPMVPTAAS